MRQTIFPYACRGRRTFSITGCGTVATGRRAWYTSAKSDVVEIIGISEEVQSVKVNLDGLRLVITSVSFLRVQRTEIQRGSVSR